MNGMNEKAPESHECERKLRLQRQREQRRARLARETKEQRQRRLQLRREETDVVSKVVGLKKQARKHRSDSGKAERQGDGSIRQCQTAEQRARRLLDQSEGNACRHENETTATTQPAIQG